jgi:hypothetical protein
MIAEIAEIINIPDFLTETIDNHTNALDQKINTTNDQIQGNGIKDQKPRTILNFFWIKINIEFYCFQIIKMG